MAIEVLDTVYNIHDVRKKVYKVLEIYTEGKEAGHALIEPVGDSSNAYKEFCWLAYLIKI